MAKRSSALRSPSERRPGEIASKVARLAKAALGPDTEVIWFGSWARGRGRLGSDIDIAPRRTGPFAPEQIAALRNAVDDLPTLYSVDLLDLASIGPALKQEILRHGVRL